MHPTNHLSIAVRPHFPSLAHRWWGKEGTNYVRTQVLQLTGPFNICIGPVRCRTCCAHSNLTGGEREKAKPITRCRHDLPHQERLSMQEKV